jgi:hypothetical protein
MSCFGRLVWHNVKYATALESDIQVFVDLFPESVLDLWRVIHGQGTICCGIINRVSIRYLTKASFSKSVSMVEPDSVCQFLLHIGPLRCVYLMRSYCCIRLVWELGIDGGLYCTVISNALQIRVLMIAPALVVSLAFFIFKVA